MKKNIILIAIVLVLITIIFVILLETKIIYNEISKSDVINPLAPSPGPSLEEWYKGIDISASESDNVIAILENEETLIIRGEGRTGDYDQYYAEIFYGIDKVKNVIIEEGVTYIGDYLLASCTCTNVSIAESVIDIGDNVFEYCINLTEILVYENSYAHERLKIDYSDKLKVIEKTETWDISATEEDNVIAVLYKDGTLVISGTGNMKNSNSSSNIVWKDYRSEIKQVIIQEGITNIGDYAFWNCSNLVSIEIPSSVTNIGDYAFWNCSNLISTEIPNAVTNIGYCAFYGCSSLISVEIPDSVISIESNAFHSCSSLTSIEIPNSVTEIGGYVFYSCSSLTEIKVYCNSYAHNCVKKEYSNKIKVINHTEVIDEAVAATCTETGLTEGKHCSVCNEEIVAQEVIQATGHTEVIDEAVAATCTETGLTEGKHCLVCNEEIVAQEVIQATGHTEVIDEAVAATCTETGLTEGRHCLVCNEEIVAQEVIQATGHTEVIDEAVAATCTQVGLTEGRHCLVCNEVLLAQEAIAALGHIEVVDVGITATCTEKGKTEGKHCSICKEVLVPQEEVAALGHNYGEWTTIKEATCKEVGEKRRVCTREVCGYIEKQMIEALGHIYESKITVPTCTEKGYTTHICTRCNDTYIDSYVNAFGHSKVVYAEKVAKCEEKGWKAYEVCERCEYTTYEEISALGHNYSEEWTIDKQATCTEIGSKSHHCIRENCNGKKEETEIVALGHIEVVDTGITATCTEKGKTEGKHCSVCNKVLVTQKEIEALGHHYILGLTVPTCTEKGYTTHSCMRCNYEYVDSYTDALGHRFGPWLIDKEPTYEESGHKYRVCEVCNNEKEEQIIPKLTKEEIEIATTYTVKEEENVKFVILTKDTIVSKILLNITSSNLIKIVDKAGKELGANDLVGTGAKIVTKEGNKDIYTIVVKGDINGDSKIDFINDIIELNNYRLNIGKLDIASIIAGDINEDGKIDFINDIISINNYRLGIVNSL